MGKNPAVLWYWNDWHGGTVGLSRAVKGAYMDLLHAQFNSQTDNVTLEEIQIILGPDFTQAWPTLQKKFSAEVDNPNIFFNARAREERIKRRAYVDSRNRNLESKKGDTTSDLVRDNENTVEIGAPGKLRIVIRANGHDTVIHDMQGYFKRLGNLKDLQAAGMTKFNEFMWDNPGKIFNDDAHVYNAFRAFHNKEVSKIRSIGQVSSPV